MPDTYLIGCFVAGLKDEIRLDVKIKKPRVLAEAIGVARLIEERNAVRKRATTFPRVPTTTPLKTPSILGPPPNILTQKPAPTTPNNIPPTFKRITSQEARDRREKGLCFYCDEKFSPGHRCQRAQLYMIEDVPVEESELQQFPNPQNDPLPEISFHAMAGTNHPQTIRVLGKIRNNPITVLIDGGSTHNFIDQYIVSKI